MHCEAKSTVDYKKKATRMSSQAPPETTFSTAIVLHYCSSSAVTESCLNRSQHLLLIYAINMRRRLTTIYIVCTGKMYGSEKS